MSGARGASGATLAGEEEQSVGLLRLEAQRHAIGQAHDVIAGHSVRDVITPVERRFLGAQLCDAKVNFEKQFSDKITDAPRGTVNWGR